MRKIRKNTSLHSNKVTQDKPNPVPAPAILESYEEIAPGSASKIVEIVKKEQIHRHKLESRMLDSLRSSVRLSQILSFSFLLISLYSAVCVSALNIYLAACLVLFTFVLFIVMHLVVSRKYHFNNKGFKNRYKGKSPKYNRSE